MLMTMLAMLDEPDALSLLQRDGMTPRPLWTSTKSDILAAAFPTWCDLYTSMSFQQFLSTSLNYTVLSKKPNLGVLSSSRTDSGVSKGRNSSNSLESTAPGTLGN